MGTGAGRGIASILLQMYGAGMLGGQPKRLMDLKEAAYSGVASKGAAEAAAISATEAARDKPIWQTEPTYKPGGDPAYDPAKGGSLPREIETPGKKGMSIRQLQEMGKGVKDMPISELLSTRAGKGLVDLWNRLIFPEADVEKATEGRLYETPRTIDLEALKTEEAAGRIPKGSLEELGGTILGGREKVGQPEVGATEGGLYMKKGPGASGKFITEPTAKETGKATSVKEYEAWRAEPKYANKSYGDYIVWKASTLAEAKSKAIFGDMSKEKRMALDMAKVALGAWVDSQPYGAMDMTEDQSLTMLMELYQKALTKVHTAKPEKKAVKKPAAVGGEVKPEYSRRLDVDSIQKAIDEIKNTR